MIHYVGGTGDEIVIKLERYELDFKKGFEYFQHNLEGTNVLSSTLLNLVDFKSGRFFTLLPQSTESKKVEQFRYGGIAIGVRNQVKHIIFNKLQLDDQLTCIFDAFNTIFCPGYKSPLFLSCGLVHEKEVYYLVTQKTVSTEILNQCF